MHERHAKSGHDLATRQCILSCQDTHVRGRAIHVDLLFFGGDYPDYLYPIVVLRIVRGKSYVGRVLYTECQADANAAYHAKETDILPHDFPGSLPAVEQGELGIRRQQYMVKLFAGHYTCNTPQQSHAVSR
jgi:hypothetical protein